MGDGVESSGVGLPETTGGIDPSAHRTGPAHVLPARSPLVRRRRTRRRLLIGAAVVVALVVLAGVAPGAYFLGWLSASYNGQRQVVTSPFPLSGDRPLRAAGGAAAAQTVLLLGSDTNGTRPVSLAAVSGRDASALTLVHVPSDRKHVWMLSILPSTMVAVPGHGQLRIGQVLRAGGVPLAVQTVERLLETRVDHVVVVPSSGFGRLTSALGGVTVDNRLPFTHGPSRFPAGRLRLSGREATAYASASALPGGDRQRVDNQQQFLRGLAHAMWTPGTLLDPAKVGDAVTAIAPYLIVDGGLDAAYLGGLAVSLRDARASDIGFLTVPTAQDTDSGAVVPDRAKVATLAADLHADRLDRYKP